MEEETKLKPCPFCGSGAKVMDMGYPHWVYCMLCGARIHGGINDEKDSIENAAKWGGEKESQDSEDKILQRESVLTEERGFSLWQNIS